MGDLTTNFDIAEFECRGSNCCDHTAVIHPLLSDGLQHLRDKTRVPIYVTSGFRCQRHNKEVNGSLESYHTKGMAADINSDLMTPAELAEIANTVAWGYA